MEIKATFPVLNLSNRYIQLHFIFYFFHSFQALKREKGRLEHRVLELEDNLLRYDLD